ncbi:MAG: NAD(P)H-dependent flavin oxidoreductase, partial [Candidatus Limnocylindria bacterium]
GQAIARALRAGAQGVSLGTRFVASEEAWIHDVYKQRITSSSAEDTILNELYDVGWPNAPHRSLRNKTFDEWDAAGRPPSGHRPGQGTRIGYRRSLDGQRQEWLRYASGMLTPDFEGDLDLAPMWAGRSVSDVGEVKPAAQVVADLVEETTAALAAAARPLDRS